jgi:hypothetical protein
MLTASWPWTRPKPGAIDSPRFPSRTRTAHTPAATTKTITEHHDSAISEALRSRQFRDSRGPLAQAWVIEKEQKRRFLRQLALMNLIPRVLFPGLDGLGRSLVDLLRLAE